eukprot:TRINITY_DN11073_c0_g3_i1.p3 TRINITY_DN11073_c0_g3~~TRINITY_DN11073_c0_g3_i1.p3  ORF type:complete len:138 (-),score=2.79 TRINITY_DN11073_c0_g3_i1:319-732(-)
MWELLKVSAKRYSFFIVFQTLFVAFLSLCSILYTSRDMLMESPKGNNNIINIYVVSFDQHGIEGIVVKNVILIANNHKKPRINRFDVKQYATNLQVSQIFYRSKQPQTTYFDSQQRLKSSQNLVIIQGIFHERWHMF